MKKLKTEWLQLLILALPFCAVALLWDKLPARVPIHWNSHGQVNGYAGRTFGALFVPALNVGVTALVWFVCLIDPRVKRQDADTRARSLRAFRTIRLIISSFLCAVALTILGISVGLPLDMPRIISVGVGVMFIALGNIMGKLRPNYFVGVRTPWTLESVEVWGKTHRLAGKLMVLAGLLLLVSCLVLQPAIYIWIYLPLILTVAAVPIVYSFLLSKKHHPI